MPTTTNPISVSVSSGVAISAKSTSTTPADHVAVFNLAVDGGTNNAGLNVVSKNAAFSACEMTGQETGHVRRPMQPLSVLTYRMAEWRVRRRKVSS